MTEADRDGGPAFPARQVLHPEEGSSFSLYLPGMSLRDYFAARCITASVPQIGEPEPEISPAQIAKHAYAIADAMLAERSR